MIILLEFGVNFLNLISLFAICYHSVLHVTSIFEILLFYFCCHLLLNDVRHSFFLLLLFFLSHLLFSIFLFPYYLLSASDCESKCGNSTLNNNFCVGSSNGNFGPISSITCNCILDYYSRAANGTSCVPGKTCFLFLNLTLFYFEYKIKKKL